MGTQDGRPKRPEVAAGMAAARERGVHMGRPSTPPPASAYRAEQLRAQGLSLAEIVVVLAREGVPTPSGKPWAKGMVASQLNRLQRYRSLVDEVTSSASMAPGGTRIGRGEVSG